MQHCEQEAGTDGTQALRCAQCEEEQEQLVVFELVVPSAAQVALPSLQPEIASLTLRAESVTTTVPGKLYVQLQASNTATQAGWCMTATLAASSPKAYPNSRR